MTERKQVRPAAEGWTQAKDETGKPLLQFAEPKRKQPPVHLADLSIAERAERVKELGIQGFRARELGIQFHDATCRPPVEKSWLALCCRRCSLR